MSEAVTAAAPATSSRCAADAERAAAGGDETEDAHRLRSLGRLGEERDHQRERNRRDDRAADALNCAGGDERFLRVREPAYRRRSREESDPGQKEGPMPEQVTQPPPEQKEAAECDQVRVDDPGERLFRETEIRADRGQRDADDRHVEDDHQVAKAEDEECEPAPFVEVGPASGLGARVMSFSLCLSGHRLRRARGQSLRIARQLLLE
jgi:hypothetical protein